MKNVRVFYNKIGDVKYISHLDMNRVFTRIVRRSGIPIWYTVGFNPHPKMNFALPLSLGFESTSEIVDLRIDDDNYSCEEVAKRLADVMPAGLEVKYAADPVMKVGDIGFARFELSVDKLPNLDDYFNQEQIITMKRTKSGTKPTDIKPMIKDHFIENDKLILILSAGAINLNPNLVISTAEEYYNTEFKVNGILRTDVYNTKMESFK